ncbi:hypothetical protein L198_06214 [Cryptococcus wingfieldii CBS 7118]|uniref:Uncharacterized protein n=1 Tax=Cryptococcus wingfieldii CBS 7118 TaxID=1295528 RepID=A0A1E3IQI5_9TREE|nr:hypothetical protein L198_06214 [Cryptococcus wingfieldii CBS 7118]ODN90196.1 hypothetical protein L198_06214 [Cryptococcus wingfieldii CBS 7118]
MPFPFHPEAFALLIATLAEDLPAYRFLQNFAAHHRFPPLPVFDTLTYAGPRGAHAFQHLAARHTCTPEGHVDRRQFRAANLDSTRWFPDDLPFMNPVYPAGPVHNPDVLNHPAILNSDLKVNSSSSRRSNGDPSRAAPGPVCLPVIHELVEHLTALRDARILRCLLVQILEKRHHMLDDSQNHHRPHRGSRHNQVIQYDEEGARPSVVGSEAGDEEEEDEANR